MVLMWGTHSQQVGIWWYSGGHLVVFRWAFEIDGINLLRWGTHAQQVGIGWYSGGHLVVFRWVFEMDGIKVGNTCTTGGHLVVFSRAFGGIQVGKTSFRKWATPVGPHQNNTLAPATANEHKLAWPQLG